MGLAWSKKNCKTLRFLDYFVLSLFVGQFEGFDLMVVDFRNFEFDLFELLADHFLGILFSKLFFFVFLLGLVLDDCDFGVFDLVELSS